MTTSRFYLQHRTLAATYAVETDTDGTVLAALDLTDDAARGGICPHLLSALPLEARIEDLDHLARHRDDYEIFTPECGNVHHLMADLLAFEREHRETAATFALADSRAKAAKKDMELRAAKVHDLLNRINDRVPLPLFQAVGIDG